MRTRIRISASIATLAVMLSLLTSCVSPTTQASFTNLDVMSGHEIAADYQIGPEDVLEVLVWKNEALSKVVVVRPDGKVSLPLIGDVQAAGHTADHVRIAITEKLKAYYKEAPQVSLIIQQINSYVIYIMGEVQRPAQYVVKRGTTFLQAIALAGGFTPFASTNDILLLRKSQESNGQMALKIRYKDILSGGYQENNILLKPGDTIIIP
jgi:polysaccharide export outer membrane protein